MVVLVMGWTAENIKERRKQAEEEKESRRMRGKSNSNNIHLSFKLHFARKRNLEKNLFIPLNFIYSFYAFQGI